MNLESLLRLPADDRIDLAHALWDSLPAEADLAGEGERLVPQDHGRPEFRDALRLPVPERIELAQALWNSVIDVVQSRPLPEWQIREIERRIAEHEADPESGIPMEDFLKELEARFG